MEVIFACSAMVVPPFLLRVRAPEPYRRLSSDMTNLVSSLAWPPAGIIG